MARLTLAAAGNADENINLINPRFQAEALRHVRGYDVGILKNSFYSSASPRGTSRQSNDDFMWPLTASNVLDIAVGRGMATAYGYDLQSEETVHLRGTAPASGVKYLFIYLEWDLSNPEEAVGSINIHDNGTSTSWTPSRQDNLITNPIGIYQMPLYRVTVNTSGSVYGKVTYATLGVKVIEYPLRAEYAGRCEKADEADNATALAGEEASVSGGSLTIGGMQVFRRKLLWSGSWILYNTASKNEAITLSEDVVAGDLLQIEYNPQYYSSSSPDPTKEALVKVGAMRGVIDLIGFQITDISGGYTKNSGFTATQDNFSVSSKTVTYKGGYYLLNFANSGGTLLENNTIRIKAIYKIYV